MRGGLVLSCIAGLLVCRGPANCWPYTFPQHGPVPTRVYPLAEKSFGLSVISASPRIETTPRVLLVTSGDYRGERIVAFDRKRAVELWALPRTQPKEENSKVTLIGAATSPRSGEVAVVRRTADSATELQGLDALTGAVRWQFSLSAGATNPAPATVSMHGSLVSIADEVESRSGNQGGEWRTLFLDAFRGKLVQPGRDLRPAAGDSSLLALTQTPAYRPCLLRLDTGQCISLPIFRTLGGWGSTGSPVGATRTRAIVHVTTDDDGAGHSGWPRYLFAADKVGRKAWQYPRRLVFPGISEKTDWGHYESIVQVALIPEASRLVALSSRGQFVGIRVSDGAVSWRSKSGSQDTPSVLSLAPFRQGCFVLTRNSFVPSATVGTHLIYVDARTGNIRQIASLPGARSLWVRGNELFALSAMPAVEAFSCAGLLSARPQNRSIKNSGYRLR